MATFVKCSAAPENPGPWAASLQVGDAVELPPPQPLQQQDADAAVAPAPVDQTALPADPGQLEIGTLPQVCFALMAYV